MPQSPAFIGNLAQSALGRRARVLDVSAPAPGFIELQLAADAPPGGWHPGHEIQFRVTPTLGRRYTVRTVNNSQELERIGILVDTTPSGPGAAWISRLRPGDDMTLLAGRHRSSFRNGTRRLCLGDACSLGTLDAYGQDNPVADIVIEVRAKALPYLAIRWPKYRFVPATDAPGDALQSWLETAIVAGDLGHISGAWLLGHAQSIQRHRKALIEGLGLARRSVTVRPYWADGKYGL